MVLNFSLHCLHTVQNNKADSVQRVGLNALYEPKGKKKNIYTHTLMAQPGSVVCTSTMLFTLSRCP